MASIRAVQLVLKHSCARSSLPDVQDLSYDEDQTHHSVEDAFGMYEVLAPLKTVAALTDGAGHGD